MDRKHLDLDGLCALCGLLRAVLISLGAIAKSASFGLVLGALLLGFSQIKHAHAQVTYTYDELGRVTSVTAPSGDSAQYIYDALGNIIEIKRFTSTQIAIHEFTPNSGPVGASVTIIGQGFSATPGSNTVQFNGTVASVSSASTTQLVAVVPSGATTGTISVTVAANTATSAQAFTVTAPVGAPTITGFTPSIGPAGTSVTITGTNFDLAPNATKVALNTTLAQVTAVSTTSVTAVVPASASSGKISVQTLAGTAFSANDFIASPPGIASADIVATLRLAVDGAAGNLAINTATKYGLVLVDLLENDYVSVDATAFTTTPAWEVNYWVYDRYYREIATGVLNGTSRTILLPRATGAGTVSVLLRTPGGTGSFTLAAIRNTAIALDAASPTTASFTFAGRSVRYLFTAAAGDNLGLGVSGISLTPTGSTGLTISRPDGVSYAIVSPCATVGCAVAMSNMTMPGIYTVAIKAGGSSTGTANLSVTRQLALDNPTPGQSYSYSLKPGQFVRVTYAGTSGGAMGMQVAGVSSSPVNHPGLISTYRPDGVSASSYAIPQPAGYAGVLTGFTMSGTYTSLIGMDVAYGGTMNLQITVDPAGSTSQGKLTIDGATLARTGGVAGSRIWFSFDGIAGEHLGLGFTGLAVTGGSNIQMNLYKPDGAFVVATACYVGSNGGCSVELSNLPQTGKYWLIGTANGSTASATLTRQIALTPIPGTTYTYTNMKPGQLVRMSYAATTGLSQHFMSSGMSSTPANAPASMRTYRPNGSLYDTGLPQPGSSSLIAFDATGTYTGVVGMNAGYGGTLSMQLTMDAAAAGGQLVIDGATLTKSTTVGMQLVYSFNATAGDHLGLGLSSLTTVPAGSTVTFQIYRPNGALYTSGPCYPSNNGCSFELTNLPVTGKYWVVGIPSGTTTATVSATLYRQTTLAPVAGTTYTYTNLKPGQLVRMSYAGTTGTSQHFMVSGVSSPPLNMRTYRPNGSFFSDTGFSQPGNSALVAFDATGTFTGVFGIVSSYGGSGNLQVTMDAAAAGGQLAINGSTLSKSTTVSGMQLVYSFDATAGDHLGIGLSSLTSVPAGYGVNFQVYRPNGVSQASGSCSPSTTGCNFELSNLPLTGKYWVVGIPFGTTTATVSATLTSQVAMTATPGTPITLTLPPGNLARIAFARTAAQGATFNFTGISSTPSGAPMCARFYNPSGAFISSAQVAAPSGSAVLAPVASTGTYTGVIGMCSGYGGSSGATVNLAP